MRPGALLTCHGSFLSSFNPRFVIGDSKKQVGGGIILFDHKVKKGSVWRRRVGTFLGLCLFLLLLLGLTPEKVCAYETPTGYDTFDYQKLVAFLEIPNGTGKNGHQISASYNPADPTTWCNDPRCQDTNSKN
jgi:hypothetical protein